LPRGRALSEWEVNGWRLDGASPTECDVEGILAFAERVLPRAGDLCVQASLDQRHRFQQLFFPVGIAFDGNRFVDRRNSTGRQLLAGNQNQE
jgi:hypothetical protein